MNDESFWQQQQGEVVRRVAMIHQQHSIKSYLALQDLAEPLQLSSTELAQLVRLYDKEPILDYQPLQQPHTVATRERSWQWLLERSVFPGSYFVMRDWVERDGFAKVWQHYLEKACEINGYLGHHITVLFAFQRMWPQLSEANRPRMLERFTEFVTTTFSHNHLEYPLPAGYRLPQRQSEQQAEIVRRPGFLLHNWITLAVLLRHQQELGQRRFELMLAQLHQRCFWEIDDKEDNPVIDWKLPAIGPIEQQLRQLLLESQYDMHQITIADAIWWLIKEGQLTPTQQQHLRAGLAYTIELCRQKAS